MIQPPVKPVNGHSASSIITCIDSLMHILRDSLRELGLDQTIAKAAEATPDTCDRPCYVMQMTA